MIPGCYGANVKVQKKSRESVVYVVDMMRERLVQFYKQTGPLPNTLLLLLLLLPLLLCYCCCYTYCRLCSLL